jgi:hypothetical protein
MDAYRLYLLDVSGGILRVETLYAESDEAALRLAEEYARNSSCSGLEVWLGSRRIVSRRPK